MVTPVVRRSFATMRAPTCKTRIPKSIISNLPLFDAVNGGPPLGGRGKKKMNSWLANRKPVTSAHAVDVRKGEMSSIDSASIGTSGSVIHGRYGELGPVADAVPLEYLALLRPAAEGAAAKRVLSNGKACTGTFLVYGASEANGMAAAQIASAAGHAVVGVVGGNHSGNQLVMESIKGLIKDPGVVVPEVYALSKKNFSDLVDCVSSGDEGVENTTAEEYVQEFKYHLLDYVDTFPEVLTAAVDEDNLKFSGMGKDQGPFKANMDAFLSQFTPGSPPIEEAQLDALFSKEQYDVFRRKFWQQTTNVISGDDCPSFSAPHIVKELLDTPRESTNYSNEDIGPRYPYSFSVLKQCFPNGSAPPAGGSVLGAVIALSPTLESAAKRIAVAKSRREKAEALHFLTSSEKGAFGAASSVVSVARSHGAPIYTVGGCLPGLDALEPSEEDLHEALLAMDVGEDGSAKLNYFIQTYRACDFPLYSDYAVHRATEEMAGPRQVVVAK